jgi:hypothetical protein
VRPPASGPGNAAGVAARLRAPSGGNPCLASRGGRALAALALPFVLAACCPGGKCIKDPPCRPCENPCCLTPVQKAALGKGQHALPAPVVYLFEDRPYVLLTEKGLDAFHADPGGFKDKDAVRRFTGGKAIYLDFEPGKDVDVRPWLASARPYVAPPAGP